MKLSMKLPGKMAMALILGNVVLAIALASMTLQNVLGHRQAEQERARDVVDNLAQNLSKEVGAELRNADNALSTIAQHFHSLPGAKVPGDALERLLVEQRALLPQVSALRMTDIYGRVVVGLGADEQGLSVADRGYFTQAMMSQDMVISEPLQSRVSGQWGVILARRLINHDGQFSGIVYALVNSQHFVERFGQVALGPSGAISLRSRDLNLIARYSATEPASTKGFGGRTLSKELERNLAISREHGSYLTPTALDQIERITAYRAVPGFAMTVFTGMSSTDFLSSWRRQALQQSLLTALVVLLVAAASRFIFLTHQGERRSRMAMSRLAREQRAMLQNDLIGMVRVCDDKAVWTNPALAQMFGYAATELYGRETDLLFGNASEHAYVRAVGSATIRSGGRFRTQLRMRRKDGTTFWVDLSGMVLNDAETLWMLVDIDALKQSEEKAQDLALRDALTQLPNRRLFEARVADAIGVAQRTGKGFAVCYLDLDGFKPVNDRYGHEAGDQVLVAIAERLQSLVRANDVVARLGGDEFAILLGGIDRTEDVEPVLGRALVAIQQRIALASGEVVNVGASIGAVLGGGVDTGRDLLHAADEAMYAVKRCGKGRMLVAGGVQPVPPLPSVPHTVPAPVLQT